MPEMVRVNVCISEERRVTVSPAPMPIFLAMPMDSSTSPSLGRGMLSESLWKSMARPRPEPPTSMVTSLVLPPKSRAMLL